ncbi:fimbria/pilus periplasmic chaperone [Pseudocitrobacter cyperus]|uniref:Fimbria/pilus periplasmic chaperone n=1 Tax=Pseudocitrobacter cyperus TaxID=3112843 RepID=A0ABV0HHN9_9ENTR
MKIFLRASLILCALFSIPAQADVTIGATRVIYPGGAKDATITVENANSDAPFLIQSWVRSDNASAEEVPFIVTPPLFRLNARQKNVLRIINTGGNLPQDRESLFWLNIKAIPTSVPEDQQNKLVLAVKSEFKLIYRPKALTQKPEDVTDKLRWQQQGGRLIVNNPTAYYMNLANVTVGGVKIKEARYLAPFSNDQFSLPSGAHGQVTWALINDFGGTGPQHKQP